MGWEGRDLREGDGDEDEEDYDDGKKYPTSPVVPGAIIITVVIEIIVVVAVASKSRKNHFSKGFGVMMKWQREKLYL